MSAIPVRKLNKAIEEPRLLRDFSIRSIEDITSGAVLKQELHRHDYYFILIVCKGSGTHEVDFDTYEIGDNSIFIMDPGQVHQLELLEETTGFIIQFTTHFLSQTIAELSSVLESSCLPLFQKLDDIFFKELLGYIRHIQKEFQNAQKGFLHIMGCCLLVVFTELIRLSDADCNRNTTYEHTIYNRFTGLIKKHGIEHYKVSDYAKLLNLSVYQLNAATKVVFRKTASEIINDAMMLEAKRHLLATTAQVNEIAYRLGFSDDSNFNKFFKRHHGSTPEQFRVDFINTP